MRWDPLCFCSHLAWLLCVLFVSRLCLQAALAASPLHHSRARQHHGQLRESGVGLTDTSEFGHAGAAKTDSRRPFVHPSNWYPRECCNHSPFVFYSLRTRIHRIFTFRY